MADLIKGTGHGMTTAQWSTSGMTTTLGICTSCEVETTAEREPIPNQAGGTQARLYYDTGRTATLEILVKDGQTAPKPGDDITITLPAAGGGTLDGIVESAKYSGRLKQWQVFNVTVEKKDAMTL